MIKTFTITAGMIIFLAIGTAFLLVGFSAKKSDDSSKKSKAIASFYDLKATSIDGEEISFEKYKGKKVLIVNTASSCGYTYQYEGLQKLNDIYGNDVEVLGFPANDFLFQVSPNHLSIRGDKGLGELRESFEFQHLPEGWLHLACVVSTRGVTAFSNGSKIGFSNVKGNNIGFHNPEGATIGTADYWGKAKDEPFEGRLDDLRIYDRTLSTNEVQALYKFGQ